MTAIQTRVIQATFLCVLAAGCSRKDADRVVEFRTMEWVGVSAQQLLVRRLDSNGDVLALKGISYEDDLRLARGRITVDDAKAIRGVVYVYDSRKQRVTPAHESVWDQAKGPIGGSLNAQDVLPRPSGPSSTPDPWSHVRGFKSQAAGKTVLRMYPSPSEKLVAVLSASGERVGSIMPFLGQGGATGQHYHETVRAMDRSRVGDAIRLPISSKDSTLQACWSPDERFVIYSDVGYMTICIVRVDQAEGSE